MDEITKAEDKKVPAKRIITSGHRRVPRWKRFLYIGNVSQKQVLFFTKNLFIMLKAGLTLTEALIVLKDQIKGKLQFILNDVYDEVAKGYKLSEALEKTPKVFSDIYTNVIKVGEESGNLEQNLEYLAGQLGKNQALKRKVTGAMIYPAIVFIGGICLSLGIAIFILPKVTKMFDSFQIELPLTTRILIGVSNFFQAHGLIATVSIIGGLIFLFWFFRRKFVQPVSHWLILRLPIVKNIALHLNLTTFTRTLSILLDSGITIDDSIKICTKTVSNYYYKKFLRQTYTQVKAGDSLASILQQNKKLFPITDVQIIQVGEVSGTLSNSLKFCSSIHEDEVDNITKNLSTILEPILLVTIGLMVGFLALAIITPIYSITGKMRY
ncbi:MAG: type II secretion system F family protein [Patescibacteria group bacterium]